METGGHTERYVTVNRPPTGVLRSRHPDAFGERPETNTDLGGHRSIGAQPFGRPYGVDDDIHLLLDLWGRSLPCHPSVHN